jgi:hypothetical protein
MCTICDEASKLSVPKALRLVAEAMKKPGGRRECLDRLVGKLVNVESRERDVEAEEQWERSRD